MSDKISLSPPETTEFDSNLNWLDSKLYRTTKSVAARTITFSNDTDGTRVTVVITNQHTASCVITWPSYVIGALTSLPSKATAELTFTKIGNSVYSTQDVLYYQSSYAGPGTFTITPPAGVTKLKMIGTPSGGGGGGGGFNPLITTGGGGGGGGGRSDILFTEITLTNLNPITLTLGAGGVGGSGQTATLAATRGATGGNSTIVQNSITLATLYGGTGGYPGNGSQPGAGGSVAGFSGTAGTQSGLNPIPGFGGEGATNPVRFDIVNSFTYIGGRGGDGVSVRQGPAGFPGSNGVAAEVRLIFY